MKVFRFSTRDSHAAWIAIIDKDWRLYAVCPIDNADKLRGLEGVFGMRKEYSTVEILLNDNMRAIALWGDLARRLSNERKPVILDRDFFEYDRGIYVPISNNYNLATKAQENSNAR